MCWTRAFATAAVMLTGVHLQTGPEVAVKVSTYRPIWFIRRCYTAQVIMSMASQTCMNKTSFSRSTNNLQHTQFAAAGD